MYKEIKFTPAQKLNNQMQYFLVSGSVFALVAAAHLVRLVTQASIIIGSCTVPMMVSWAGLVVAAFLCFWSFELRRQYGEIEK
jgi:hypothetical protein